MPAVAVILLVSLCTPAFADLAAGQRAWKDGDYATALKELLPLAQQGNAVAQVNVGLMYNGGQGVPQDVNEALRWYRLAAEQGLADASSSSVLRITKAMVSLRTTRRP